MLNMSAKFDDRELQKSLNGFMNRSSKKERKTLAAIFSVEVDKDIQDHFRKSQGPDGKWKPWSDEYAAFMQKIGKGGNNILMDSGHLRSGFKKNNNRIEKGNIIWFNNATTKGGFPYAFAHDEGGPILPQRGFMWMSMNTLTKIAKLAARFMAKGKK